MSSALVVERVVIGDGTGKVSGKSLHKNVLYASEDIRGGVDTFHAVRAQSPNLSQSQLSCQKYFEVGKPYSVAWSWVAEDGDKDFGAALECGAG